MTRRPRRRPRLITAALVGSMLLAACGSDAASTAPVATSALPGAAAGQPTANELKYGASPHQDPRVTYQPDVVFVGGAESVKSVSADGLVWTISGAAEHVEDLQPGRIMFASSLGVGRVLAVSQSGADKQVVLGPATITEVVRDGDFSSPDPVLLDSVVAYTAPTRPGAVSDIPDAAAPGPASTPGPSAAATPDTATPSAATTSAVAPSGSVDPDTLRLPTVHLMAHVAGQPAAPRLAAADVPSLPPLPSVPSVPPLPSLGTLPLPLPAPPALPLNQYTVTSTCCKAGASIHVDYDKNGVRMSATLAFHLDSPSVYFNLKIAGGKLVNANVQLHGAGGVAVAFQANAINGLKGNIPRQRIEVPVDFQVPVAGLGIPLTVGLGQLFSVSTYFTAQDASLSSSADYSFGGSIGFGIQDGGKASLYNPQGFAVKKGLIDNALSVSAGPAGIALSYAVKLSLGIGFLGFRAGVWFQMTVNLSLVASALVSLVACRSATLSVVAKYGLGYSIPQPVADLINAFLKLFGALPIQARADLEGPPVDVYSPPPDTVPAGAACS